jgi:hypothetical protein
VPIAVALAALVLAVWLAPLDRARPSAPTAWPEPIVRAAALGRTYAAADVAWLQTVQIVGSGAAEQGGFQGLDDWVDLATTLDPRFDLPYYFGAILLVTDEARADRVDALLARGEAAMPDQFQLPMYRGFLSYFGRLDLQGAAEHYQRAAKKPGAPAYLARFAARLATEEETCGSVMRDLREVSDAAGGDQRQALQTSSGKVLLNCIQTRIERVANAWRVKHERKPTLEDLVSQGLLDAEELAIRPPGLCWALDDLQKASLVPCAREAQP